MAEPIGALRVEMSANAASFEKDMGKARKAVRGSVAGMQSQFKRLSKSIAGIGGAFTKLRGILAGGAVVGFIDMQRRALEAGEAISDTAKKAGVSAEFLQKMRFAGINLGLAMRDVDDGLTRFTKRLGQFEVTAGGPTIKVMEDMDKAMGVIVQGGGPAAVAIDKLGIAVLDAQGKFKGTEVLFLEVVDALGKLESQAARTALQAQLFGIDAGPRLNQFVSVGREGIQQLTDRAEELGIVIGQDLLDASVEANAKFKELKAIMDARFIRNVAQNAEVWEKFAETLVNVALAAVEATAAIGEFFSKSELKTLEAQVQGLDSSIDNIQRRIDRQFIRGGEQESELRKRQEQYIIERQLAQDRIEELKKEQELQRDFNKEIIKLKDAEFISKKDAAAAQKSINELEREAQNIFNNTRTAAEKYAETIERLNFLLEQGKLDQDTYNRAVEQAQKTLEDAKDEADDTESIMEELGATFASAFEDAVVEGEKFSDVLKALEKDIIRLATRKLILEPLLEAFEKLLGGITGGGSSGGGGKSGLLGKIFSSVFGAIFGGGSSKATGPPANTLPGFATGGSFTVGGRGGVDNNIVAFRASRGEQVSVTPPGAVEGGRGAVAVNQSVAVNVYAPPGSNVEQREQDTPTGRQIDIMIDEAVAKNIGAPGSRTNRAIKNTFGGVNPRLRGR